MPRTLAVVEFLSEGPAVSWRTLGIVAGLQVAVAVLVNQVVFELPWLPTITRVSGGWIQPTLLAAAAVLFIVVGVGIRRVGKLRMVDVYWRRQSLVPALVVCAAAWAAAQLLVAAVELVRGHPLQLHPSWAHSGVGVIGGALVAQVVGNALVEETVFRGFFFPQLTRLLRPALRSNAAGVTAALIGSQLFFALYHIPNQILADMSVGKMGVEAAQLLLAGTVFALLFLVTRNIWVVVGLHALGNRPTGLFDTSDTTLRAALLLVVVVLVALWRPASRTLSGDLRSAVPEGNPPDGR